MLSEEDIKQLLAASSGDKYFFDGDTTFIKEQNITVQSGGNFYNGSQPKQEKKDNPKVDEVKILLDEMLEASLDCNQIFTEQYQWYAVYRVLNEKMNYPKKMSDFFRRMQILGYDKARVCCNYASLKQGSQYCPKLSVNVDQWNDYKHLSDSYTAMCKVAEYLLKRLGFVE